MPVKRTILFHKQEAFFIRRLEILDLPASSRLLQILKIFIPILSKGEVNLSMVLRY